MTPDPHEEVKDQRQYIPARASIVFYQRLRVLLPPPSPSSPDQHHNHNSSSGGAGPKRHSQTSSALTVRLLEPGTGTLTTELLGLAAAVVGDEEGTVELGEGLLEQVLGVLIDELLVVGDQGLGDCLSDGAVHMSVYVLWYPQGHHHSSRKRGPPKNCGVGQSSRSGGGMQRTRSEKCDHHRRHGHGCRGRRTCQDQRRAGARRPLIET